MLPTALFVTGIFTLLAAYAVRVRIYIAVKFDRVATPLLKDTFITTFSDFLWAHLYRERDRIDAKYRVMILAYFWLTVVSLLLWAAAGLSYWLAG